MAPSPVRAKRSPGATARALPAKGMTAAQSGTIEGNQEAVAHRIDTPVLSARRLRSGAHVQRTAFATAAAPLTCGIAQIRASAGSSSYTPGVRE
jgi:hypothetical protein